MAGLVESSSASPAAEMDMEEKEWPEELMSRNQRLLLNTTLAMCVV